MLKTGTRIGFEHTFINFVYEEEELTFNSFRSLALVTNTNNSLRVI